MAKKIIILHIFTDEKFFDATSTFFDSLNDVENLYYFYSDKAEFSSFKYIKMNNKVKIFSSFNEYKKILSSSDIDIIYLQSLPIKFYRFIRYINPKTIVIWWCFGFEIYYPLRLLPPLIRINLYKPLTLQYIQTQAKHSYLKIIARFIYRVLFYPWDYICRRRILKRIDYFSPVLPIEYKMMTKIPYFKAKPFMINGGPGLFEDIGFSYFSYAQNILIGNSLTYTNNHLDIFEKIRYYRLANQQYIIPINYGNDYDANIKAFKVMSGLPDNSVIWIENFMSFDKYRVMLSTVSHAIFGHMRQQAMGNISKCLENGAKIFLYKDSLIYKQLIDFGYVVYTIEEDLCEEALKKPLSREDALNNYSIRTMLTEKRITQTEKELKEIMCFHR